MESITNQDKQDLVDKILSMRKQGMSTIDISYEVRISPATISKILKKAGCDTGKLEIYKIKKQRRLDEIYDLFINKGLSTKEISEIKGLNIRTIQMRLKEIKNTDPERGKMIAERIYQDKLKRMEFARRFRGNKQKIK